MMGLHDLIQERNWSRAVVYLQEHPEEANVANPRGETPLICACGMIPNEDIPTREQFLWALIAVNPNALLSTHPTNGDLPLHMICRMSCCFSSELLQEFLIRQPVTAWQPNKVALAHTPLFVLLQRVPFFRENGTNFPRSYWNPEVHHIISNYLEKVELLVDAMMISQQQLPTNHPGIHLLGCNKSTENNNSTHPTTPYIIHAFLSLAESRLSMWVLEYLADKYPRQLRIRDESGQLPLHLFLTTYPAPRQVGGMIRVFLTEHPHGRFFPRGQGFFRVLLTKYPHAARARLFSKWGCPDNETSKKTTSSGTVYGRYPLHIALAYRRRWRDGTREIFQAAPDIARLRDPVNGRYPLHTALAIQLTWYEGIQQLVEAAPEILSVQDPVTMLYPFQLAALAYQDSRELHLQRETIFQLVRHRPDLCYVKV